MKNLLTILLGIGLSSSLLADNPQSKMKVMSTTNKEGDVIEKQIMTKTSDGAHEKSLSEVLSWVESETDGGSNIEVFVTVDDDGRMTVKKNGNIVRMRGAHKTMGTSPAPHVMAFAESQHRSRPHMRMFEGMRMSEGAANCILKNISKVNSDSASLLLKQACIALNPNEEQSEE